MKPKNALLELVKDDSGRFAATLTNVTLALADSTLSGLYRDHRKGRHPIVVHLAGRVEPLDVPRMHYVRFRLQYDWGFAEISIDLLLDALAAAGLGEMLDDLPSNRAE